MTSARLHASAFELGPPDVPVELVADVVRRDYGIDDATRRLSGERDLNLVFGSGAHALLCKVSSPDELDVVVDLQIEALIHLEARAPIAVPRLIRTVDGATSTIVESGGVRHAVRMLTFLPGEPFEGDEAIDAETLAAIGRAVGALAAALADFEHPGAQHFVLWDISNGVLADDRLWATLGDDADRLARPHRDRLVNETLPALGRCRRQVIHNDAHAGNVLRDPGSGGVGGVIDFGDMVEAPLVNDLAISAAGFVRNDDLSPIEAVAALASGYHDVHPLERGEVELLYDAVVARLVLTVLLFDHQIHHGTGHAEYSREARPAAVDDLAGWLEHDRSAAIAHFLAEVGS